MWVGQTNYHKFVNVKVLHSFIVMTLYSVGCSKTHDSFSNRLLNASAFSQAPGTEISLLCNISDREEIVYSTCLDNGRWEPDPNSRLCQEGSKILNFKL